MALTGYGGRTLPNSYDSVDASAIPMDAEVAFYYVDGLYSNQSAVLARKPKRTVSIAVHPQDQARFLDVEPGDASASQAAGWFRHEATIKQGELAGFYASASQVQGLINAVAGQGIPRSEYLIWSAHYTDREHICGPGTCGYPQADGTQWWDHALGRNLDINLLLEDKFFPAPAPPPDPNHYDWYPDFEVDSPFGKIKERDVVLHYDGAKPHRLRYDHLLRFDLEPKCGWLAARLATVAHDKRPDISVADALVAYGNHAGWRFQMLEARAHGLRVA